MYDQTRPLYPRDGEVYTKAMEEAKQEYEAWLARGCIGDIHLFAVRDGSLTPEEAE